VTQEAARFLQNADHHLERGQTMIAAGLNYDAGRAAYLAAFHAAQAVIFEPTGGKVVKTHRGVQSEFLRLTKDDPALTPDQRGFLSRAYDFKAVADYDTGPIAEVSSEEAVNAVKIARTFVATVRRVLRPQPHMTTGRTFHKRSFSETKTSPTKRPPNGQSIWNFG
jgi:uncharacterized protein (UPF0332 family)